ncbi:hypothetical protein AVEN_242330-1 [Araneus ventricosus]|uniref:Uncharacterized protein n=1 Tax=Araneus ventricosus TaxID=182803 RepID=A0A4Y2IEC6_ARAVE|nr:hypothetical protein AVEN_242330-1 [Araneus ventricosus]
MSVSQVPPRGTTTTWMRSSGYVSGVSLSWWLWGVVVLAISRWQDVPPTGGVGAWAGDDYFVTDHRIRVAVELVRSFRCTASRDGFF